jgi:hypothetical protein
MVWTEFFGGSCLYILDLICKGFEFVIAKHLTINHYKNEKFFGQEVPNGKICHEHEFVNIPDAF